MRSRNTKPKPMNIIPKPMNAKLESTNAKLKPKNVKLIFSENTRRLKDDGGPTKRVKKENKAT